MSEVVMRGSRRNVIGLLRLMADEIESGDNRSCTAFSERPDWDPTMKLTVEVADDQPHDTTLEVRRV